MNTAKPILIGLTGSIGMGKSTVASFFAEHGIPVWDADKSVHDLYQKGALGYEAIAKLVPEAAAGSHSIDTGVLSDAIQKDFTLLKKIEALIHPLVANHRAAFIEKLEKPIALFDIPLIYELGNQDQFDVIVVVDAGAEIQRKRVLARPQMTEQKFETILSKQMPNDEKTKRADFVVDTSTTLQETATQVSTIIEQIKARYKL